MDKIDLENIIFARAARLSTSVECARGELICCAADICLQELLCVYNAFFATENRRFLADDEQNCSWWFLFTQQQRWRPPALKQAFGVPFFKQDFPWEFFCASQKTPPHTIGGGETKTD